MKKSKYIGQTINGFEIVDSYHVNKPYRNTIYVCKCALCGKISDYSISDILNKKARCKCNRKRKYRNGFDMKSRLYNIYRSIIKRTQNPKNKDYKNYGGRGIILCQEWDDDYRKFYYWSMENGYKDNLSIDRIDVNGNYVPNNCRWVDMKTQINNTRVNHRITYNGENHTIAEWAEKSCVSYGTFKGRIRRGWSVEKALNEPICEKHSRKSKRDDKNAV